MNSDKDQPAPVGQVDRQVMGWQPIETAPRDGTMIELLGENGKFDIGEWYEWSEHFDKAANGIGDDVTGEFSTEYGEGPHTHWRPLRHNAALRGGEAVPLEITVRGENPGKDEQ